MTAKLVYDNKEHEMKMMTDNEGNGAIDITDLRAKTGLITFDSGYANTGSCESAITYIDGEKGILRYRGYDIADLAGHRFSEIAHLLVYGSLPDATEWREFQEKLVHYTMIHEDMRKFFEGFPPNAHPMAILSSMIASLSAYYPENTEEDVNINMIRLLAKAKTIAAFSYKKSKGQPIVYPKSELSYSANFLRMMFSTPVEDYSPPKLVEDALNLLLILHADHEQNCSTSTVRMVGSSGANLFASVSAGVSALWGPLHGGANQAVIEMLDKILNQKIKVADYVDMVKNKKEGIKLMGFGHRVYKNYDPRATILKKMADDLFKSLNLKEPLFDIARELEAAALSDSYFKERSLYPNVDFYSGIIYRAIKIPTNMFTVMFALGRLPGWIAHWKEQREGSGGRIYRPRQLYTGPKMRKPPVSSSKAGK